MEEFFLGNSFYNSYDLWNFSDIPKHCSIKTEPKLIFASYMIFIIAFGLIGNFFVISSIFILKEYKTSATNRYILQLALSNSLFLMMLSFTADSHIKGTWNFSLPLCKFKEAMIFINYYASIYFLVIMSLDRYLAVTKAYVSTKFLRFWRSPITSYLMSLFGWVISALLCIQLFKYSTITQCGICAYEFPQDKSDDITDSSTDYFNSYFDEDSNLFEDDLLYALVNKFAQTINDSTDDIPDENESECLLTTSRVLKIWLFGNFVGAFCLPFLLISFFYGVIIIKLSRSKTTENLKAQCSNKRRVTIMVLCLCTLFVISWLPWYIEKMARYFGLPLSEYNCNVLETAVRALTYLNSALNPFIFSLFGSNFRKRISQVRAKLSFEVPLRSKRPRSKTPGTVQVKNCISVSIEAKTYEKKNNLPICVDNIDSLGEFSRKANMSLKTERTIV